MSTARIIVIEDNPADIRLLRQALDQTGHEYALKVLTDGEAAVRFLREHCHSDEHPCLIVLDLHLPRYDGIAVLREIRTTAGLCHVDVAVLTTVASPSEEAEVRDLGVALYSRKPADWDSFLELGAELMKLCNGGRAQAAVPPA